MLPPFDLVSPETVMTNRFPRLGLWARLLAAASSCWRLRRWSTRPPHNSWLAHSRSIAAIHHDHHHRRANPDTRSDARLMLVVQERWEPGAYCPP